VIETEALKMGQIRQARLIAPGLAEETFDDP
jgi:hypothetical protein